MLRSPEAAERAGSRVRRTFSSFEELLRFNFNSDAFSPSPPAREPQRTKPPHPPPVFSCDRGTDLRHCLWMDVSRGHSLGPRSPTESVLRRPVPAIPPSPRLFSALYLFASIVPPGGRVLFAYFEHTFPGSFSLNQSLERRPHVSLRPWPETPLDKRLPSAYGMRTARGAAGSAPLAPGPAAAPPSLRPSHLSGARGPSSPDCVMESSPSFHQPRPTASPRADS